MVHLTAKAVSCMISSQHEIWAVHVKCIPEFTVANEELLGAARSALTAIDPNYYGTVMVVAAGNTSSVEKTKMLDNKVPLSYSFEVKGIPTAEPDGSTWPRGA